MRPQLQQVRVRRLTKFETRIALQVAFAKLVLDTQIRQEESETLRTSRQRQQLTVVIRIAGRSDVPRISSPPFEQIGLANFPVMNWSVNAPADADAWPVFAFQNLDNLKRPQVERTA